MLLDYAVRPKGAHPPLAVLGGLPYLLWTEIEFIVAHLIVMPRWGLAGLVLHLTIGLLTVAADGLVSNSFGANVRTLRANGFTDKGIATTMAFNFTLSQTLSYFLTTNLCYNFVTLQGPWALPWSPASVLAVLGKVALNLVVSEFTFTAAHHVLHAYLPEVHLMHHCCITPSMSTNAIFHPLDLLLEFAGTGTSTLLIHFLVWETDEAVLLLSYLTILIWYNMQHDEYLKLHHYTHHTTIDAVYTIYVKIRGNTKSDRVKHVLLKASVDQ